MLAHTHKSAYPHKHISTRIDIQCTHTYRLHTYQPTRILIHRTQIFSHMPVLDRTPPLPAYIPSSEPLFRSFESHPLIPFLPCLLPTILHALPTKSPTVKATKQTVTAVCDTPSTLHTTVHSLHNFTQHLYRYAMCQDNRYVPCAEKTSMCVAHA